MKNWNQLANSNFFKKLKGKKCVPKDQTTGGASFGLVFVNAGFYVAYPVIST